MKSLTALFIILLPIYLSGQGYKLRFMIGGTSWGTKDAIEDAFRDNNINKTSSFCLGGTCQPTPFTRVIPSYYGAFGIGLKSLDIGLKLGQSNSGETMGLAYDTNGFETTLYVDFSTFHFSPYVEYPLRKWIFISAGPGLFLINHHRSDGQNSGTNFTKYNETKLGFHLGGRFAIFRIKSLRFSFITEYRFVGNVKIGPYGVGQEEQLPATQVSFNHLDFGGSIDIPLVKK